MSIQLKFEGQALERLTNLSALFPAARKKALGQAALKIIQISQGPPNAPPILTGRLRGAWFVYVEGRKLRAGRDSGEIPESTAARPGYASAQFGYNTPYAAYQHENLTPAGDLQPGPRSEQAGNVGGKFLEKAMISAEPERVLVETLRAEIVKSLRARVSGFAQVGRA